MNSELYDALKFGEVDLVEFVLNRSLEHKESGSELHASLIRSSSDYEEYAETFRSNHLNGWGLEYEKMLTEKEYKERKLSEAKKDE